MVRAGVFSLGLVALSGAAAAQHQQQPAPKALDLSTATVREACEQPGGGEVVVCGELGRSRYRIDETTLDTIRRKQRALNPPRPPERHADVEPCKGGANGCPGEGAVDFIGPALKVATAVVKAVTGEDWREPFRTGPDEYELHEQSRREAESPGDRPDD